MSLLCNISKLMKIICSHTGMIRNLWNCKYKVKSYSISVSWWRFGGSLWVLSQWASCTRKKKQKKQECECNKHLKSNDIKHQHNKQTTADSFLFYALCTKSCIQLKITENLNLNWKFGIHLLPTNLTNNGIPQNKWIHSIHGIV